MDRREGAPGVLDLALKADSALQLQADALWFLPPNQWMQANASLVERGLAAVLL